MARYYTKYRTPSFALIDEAQDTGIVELRFPALGAERADSLFFAGNIE